MVLISTIDIAEVGMPRAYMNNNLLEILDV